MDLCDALRAQFLIEVPETVLDALSALGSDLEAAGFFAGSAGAIPRRRAEQSLEERAALRRVQRYRARPGMERRTPRGDDLEMLLTEARTRTEVRQEKVRSGGPVSIRGEVKVSEDVRRRSINSSLSEDCRKTIAQLLREELCDEAVEAFTDCFMEGSLWNGAPPEWLDVDALNL